MATSEIKVESRVTELATQAFSAFCDDISGTFGVDMECRQQAVAAETVAGLKKRFNKLLAVNIVDSEGLLGGTFRFIFDQEGLFTLGGMIIMLPEERIMSNRQNASAGLAESMVDAMGEAGNLLVVSWNKIFNSGDSQTAPAGHNNFSHRLPAFVGKPWDKSEETIGLAGDEEVFFIPYEMTVGSYPAFNCGVIFPKTIFGESSDFEPEQTSMIEQDIPEESDQKTQDMKTDPEKTDSQEPDKEPDIVEGNDAEESNQAQPSVEETPAETNDAGEIQEQAQAGQVSEDTAESENAAGEQSNAEESNQAQPYVEETPAETTAANDVAEESAAPEAPEEPARGKIFEAIRKITKSPAIFPGQSAMAKNEIPGVTGDLFEIRAKDIMQNKVTWAGPDDSLQQALAKMQQTDAGYIMIGQNGMLEGIVSKSDIKRAMSPYLQPIFAKWRRPLDDATLKIRIKWIMSRPVRTIKPETSLAAIMEYMSQFRGRCLPVTDEAGSVHGLVTAFDIFQALLKSGSNTSAADRTVEALVESAAPAGPA